MLKIKKYIYEAHTGLDSGMSTMSDASCRHPTTLLELSSPIQPQWSENIISPYATSITGRPKRLVVLRNHHRKIIFSCHLVIIYIYVYHIHKPPRGIINTYP